MNHELQKLFSGEDIPVLIMLITFFISAFLQAGFYLLVFTRSFKKSPDVNLRIKKYPPVSIVICARNEARNLKEKLPAILEQDYPDFEVIVVDDRSGDETADILRELQTKYSRLRTTKIGSNPKLVRGKKLALTLGIKSAKNEYLVLTDADCIPAGRHWIKYIMRNYKPEISMVIGVGLYRKKHGLLNTLIRFDTCYIAMQYISLARMNRAYMGVGRNLSYRKELFFKNKGFASHLGIDSGDDDLLVNEVSERGNTAIETHPESFTYSDPEPDLVSWLKQKKRHLTTARFYSGKSKSILMLEYGSRILFLASFVFFLATSQIMLLTVSIFIIVMLIKGIIFKIAFNRFHEKFLFLPAILLEPLIIWLYGILHAVNYIERKRSRWN